MDASLHDGHMDGVNCARWAWILLNYAPEDVINRYVDWYIERVRQRAAQMQQVHDHWWACSWRIAIGMRQSRSFSDMVDEIMADVLRPSSLPPIAHLGAPRSPRPRHLRRTRSAPPSARVARASAIRRTAMRRRGKAPSPGAASRGISGGRPKWPWTPLRRPDPRQAPKGLGTAVPDTAAKRVT